LLTLSAGAEKQAKDKGKNAKHRAIEVKRKYADLANNDFYGESA
jgi:hypothetical protein